MCKKAYYITGVLITCMEKDKPILPAAFETETRKKKSRMTFQLLVFTETLSCFSTAYFLCLGFLVCLVWIKPLPLIPAPIVCLLLFFVFSVYFLICSETCAVLPSCIHPHGASICSVSVGFYNQTIKSPIRNDKVFAVLSRTFHFATFLDYLWAVGDEIAHNMVLASLRRVATRSTLFSQYVPYHGSDGFCEHYAA